MDVSCLHIAGGDRGKFPGAGREITAFARVKRCFLAWTDLQETPLLYHLFLF